MSIFKRNDEIRKLKSREKTGDENLKCKQILIASLVQRGKADSFPSEHAISASPEMVYPVSHCTAYLDPELIFASAGVMVA